MPSDYVTYGIRNLTGNCLAIKIPKKISKKFKMVQNKLSIYCIFTGILYVMYTEYVWRSYKMFGLQNYYILNIRWKEIFFSYEWKNFSFVS